MTARGSRTGRVYREEEISDPNMYIKMKSETLFNEEGFQVVPVRSKTHPHFRKLGSIGTRTPVGGFEKNPSHDDCVNYMKDQLSEENRNIEFTTYIFNNEEKPSEEIIFKTESDNQYKWFKESECRVPFPDNTYIQPDLAGRNTHNFSPSTSDPNIIIEVIRTHEPELETFKRLLDLSKSNSQIYFYFIGEGRKSSKINHIKSDDELLKIRFSKYIIGGVLYNNGNAISSSENYDSVEDWYEHDLKLNYFGKAKLQAEE